MSCGCQDPKKRPEEPQYVEVKGAVYTRAKVFRAKLKQRINDKPRYDMDVNR